MDSGPIMWGNIPVPYTASWTGEQPFGAKIEKFAALGNAWFLHEDINTPGVGKPMLSTFHCRRAIEVLMANICQICRQSLDGRKRFCLNSGQTINTLPHITDGLPMCADCTALSLAKCPRLQADVASWYVYAVGAAILAPAILGIVEGPDARPEVNAALRRHWKTYGRGPVFGTPKLQLTRFRRFPASDFQP